MIIKLKNNNNMHVSFSHPMSKNNRKTLEKMPHQPFTAWCLSQ